MVVLKKGVITPFPKLNHRIFPERYKSSGHLPGNPLPSPDPETGSKHNSHQNNGKSYPVNICHVFLPFRTIKLTGFYEAELSKKPVQ